MGPGGSIYTTAIGKHENQYYLFIFPGEPVVHHLPAHYSLFGSQSYDLFCPQCKEGLKVLSRG